MRIFDFESWAIFATVARLGSFTKAADFHGLSKPTISKAITRLETELGSALFHRTSRRLSLTSSGKKLLPYAQNIVDVGEKAHEAGSDEVDILKGPIKLSIPISFGISNVAPVISEFMALYPDIELDIILTDEQVDLVKDSFDLAIRIGSLSDSSLIAIKIRDIKSHFIAAPSYFKDRPIPTHAEELSNLDAILYSNNSDRWTLHKAGEKDVTIKPIERLVCNNGDFMLYPILAGQGMGHLPDFFCSQYIETGALIAFLEDWNRDQQSLYIITPPSRSRPARVEALIQYLKKALS